MTRVIESPMIKLVVYVPTTHADVVRAAIGDAGGGAIGNYAHCSFSVRGQGRFLPQDGATPFIGNVGHIETVEEERIEITVSKEKLESVIAAMKAAHPYEEIAFDLYPLCEMMPS